MACRALLVLLKRSRCASPPPARAHRAVPPRAFHAPRAPQSDTIKGEDCKKAVYALAGGLKGTLPTLEELDALPGYSRTEMRVSDLKSAINAIRPDPARFGSANPFAGIARGNKEYLTKSELQGVLTSVGDALSTEEFAALMSIADQDPAMKDSQGRILHAAFYAKLKGMAGLR